MRMIRAMTTDRTGPATRRVLRCHDEARDGTAARLAHGLAAAIAGCTGRDVAVADHTGAPSVRLVRPDGRADAWLDAPAAAALVRKVPFVLFVTDPRVPAAEQAALERLADRTLLAAADTATANRWLEAVAVAAEAPEHGRAVVLPRRAARPERAVAVHRWPLEGFGADLALLRIARREIGMATGLVLGGGSARGYAHVGVLQVLREEGISWDMLAGTSGGGYVAGMWAAGMAPERIWELCVEETVHRNPLGDYTLPVTALVKGQKVRASVKRAYGDIGIEDLPLDFFVMATDLLTGQPVLLDHGPLGLSCLASASLPGIFPPVRRAPWLLIDGGVLFNVPGPQMKARGADIVIAVDLATDRGQAFGPAATKPNGWLRRVLRKSGHVREAMDAPGIVPILLRSLELMMLGAVRAHAWSFDVHIRPDVNEFGTLDWAAHAPLVERGQAAARASMPAIRRALALHRERVQRDVDAAVDGALQLVLRA